ncbi:unnamed protein product [Polarella glacialis]|nr:unnamed protein product [Polarella glacialis]
MAVLEAHNSRRATHHFMPLVWNDEGFENAQKQAEACAKAEKRLAKNYIECLSGRHGQNSLGPTKTPHEWTSEAAEALVNVWYMEKEKYDWQNPGPSRPADRFIQMMWASTSSVGMALSHDGRFCVANYFPAVGKKMSFDYKRNLRPPQEGPAPWLAAEESKDIPEHLLMAPCTESNWKAHEKVSELLEEGARWVSADKMDTALPDLDPF